MAQLPENRTSGNTRGEHLSDHNELHRLHNILDQVNLAALEETADIAAAVATEAAARSAADSAIAAELDAEEAARALHEADTTNVHGIPNTALLETTAGSTAKVAAEAVARDEAITYVVGEKRLVRVGGGLASDAIYDPVSEKTWIAHLDYGEIFVSSISHINGSVEGPVKVGEYIPTVSFVDGHGTPAIALDGDGYLVVVWLAHASVFQWALSDAPRSLSSWVDMEETGVPEGSYPSMVYSPEEQAIYCVYRAGANHADHDHMALVRRLDGQTGWENLRDTTGLVDQTSAPSGLSDVYLPKIALAPDGRVWVAWIASLGTVHDDERSNVYCIVYDPSTDLAYTPAGVSLGATVVWSEMTSAPVLVRAAARTPNGAAGPHSTNLPTLVIDSDGLPFITWNEADDLVGVSQPTHVHSAKWNGASWVHVSLGPSNGLSTTSASHVVGDGVIDVYWMEFVIDAARPDIDLVVVRSEDGGLTFGERDVVLSSRALVDPEASYDHLFWISPVRDASPKVVAVVSGWGYPYRALNFALATNEQPLAPTPMIHVKDPYWHIVGQTGLVQGASLEPAWENGWSALANWTVPAFRIHRDGTIELRGAMYRAAGAQTSHGFTLPTWARPSVVTIASAGAFGFAAGFVQIDANGRVWGKLSGGASAHTGIWMDGIRFAKDSI